MAEQRAYGGWSESVPRQTENRNSAYDEAMKFAEEQAKNREIVESAIERGNENPESIARGKEYIARDPRMAPAWLRMYPEFAPTNVTQQKP
jgi:hypothetical protein